MLYITTHTVYTKYTHLTKIYSTDTLLIHIPVTTRSSNEMCVIIQVISWTEFKFVCLCHICWILCRQTMVHVIRPGFGCLKFHLYSQTFFPCSTHSVQVDLQSCRFSKNRVCTMFKMTVLPASLTHSLWATWKIGPKVFSLFESNYFTLYKDKSYIL